MATVAGEEAKRLHLDTPLNVLLVLSVSLQLGALATHVTGRKLAALAMAGMNTALALAFTFMIFAEFLRSHERRQPGDVALLLLEVAVAVAAAVAAAIGLAKRRKSGWLFWPVWLWNFVMIYFLVYLRFFFRIYF
jgi:tellurite resistance protein TehA-like permease